MGEQRLVRDEDVVVEELDGQLLLLRSGTSDVVHLDAVATRVWALLDVPRTHAELAERVAQEFDVAPARVQDDLVPLLALLQEQGLLHLRP